MSLGLEEDHFVPVLTLPMATLSPDTVSGHAA